jgi:hypothetical protein
LIKNYFFIDNQPLKTLFWLFLSNSASNNLIGKENHFFNKQNPYLSLS